MEEEEPFSIWKAAVSRLAMPSCAYGISITKLTQIVINNNRGQEIGREIGGHYGELKEGVVGG